MVNNVATTFRLADICLLYAFFNARLDLMLLLEKIGADYDIFNKIFSLNDEMMEQYGFDNLTMRNLILYADSNALAHILQKGIANEKFLECVLKSGNRFARMYAIFRASKEHQATTYILKNKDNKEFDDEFRIYAKFIESIWDSNTKATRGIQTINNTLQPYFHKDNQWYGLLNPAFNTLLNPLAEGKFEIFAETMESIFIYLIKNFPHFYSKKFDSETILKMLPDLEKTHWAATMDISEFIKYTITNNRGIIYEF